MSYVFLPEMFHSEKQDKDFFVVRIALRSPNGTILHKSRDPLFFITEEEYKELIAKV